MADAQANLELKITADQASAVQGVIALSEKVDGLGKDLDAARDETGKLEQAWVESAFKAGNLGIQIEKTKERLVEMSKAGISKTHEAYQALTGEIKINEAELKRLLSSVKDAEKAHQQASVSVAKLDGQFQQQTVQLQEQKQALQTAGVDVENLAKEYGRLAQESQKLASIRQAEAALGFKDDIAEINRLQNAYKTMEESGKYSFKQLSDAHVELTAKLAKLGYASDSAAQASARLENGLRQGVEQQNREIQSLSQLESGLRKGAEAEAAAAAALKETAGIRSNLFHIQANQAKSNREWVTESTRLEAANKSAAAATAQSYDLANTSIARAVRTALGMAAATVGVYELKNAFQSVLETGGKFESLGASLETLMGSIEGGKTASAWISKFAMDTPLELDDVTKAFIKLKAFGLDPMDGTLRALTAQNAKMSGSAEDLQGIILALGQAWTKQKLQAEDANQLLERGVPVWDMLSKIMGKTSAEVMALSEAGKIGRKEIKALIDEMGRTSDGALEAQMKTWNGLVSNLKDNWTQFLNTIAQSGAMDYFKDQIATVNAELQQMAADGTLQERAQRIADAMVSIAQGLKSIVTGAYENRAALATLGETLAALKLAEAAGGLLAFANNMKTAGLASLGMVGTLGPAIAAVGALTFAEQRINAALEEHERRAKRVADAERDSALAKDALIAKVRETIHATEQYADTAIEGAEQVKAKNQDQAKAYAASLIEAQRYWNAMEIALRRAGDSEGADKAQAKAEAYGKAIAAATAQVEALGKAGSQLGELSIDDKKLDTFVTQLKAAATGTTDAKKEWDSYAKSLTDTDLAGIAQSAREMLGFVKTATGENSAETQRWAGIIDSVLRESLTRAGLDAEKALTGVSTETRSGIAQFESLRKTLEATGTDGKKAGAIIAESFTNLIGKAKTREDLDAIRAKLNEYRQASKATFDEMLPLYTQLEQAQTKVKASSTELAAAQAQAAKSAATVAEAYKDGTLTAEMLAKANQDAAAAQNLMAGAMEKTSNAAVAAQSTEKEYAQHNAAVAAQRRQNSAEEQAQAQARRQAASAEIQDGERLTPMYAAMAVEFERFGEAGRAALKGIEDGLGVGKYQWDVWTHAAATWIAQADEQLAAAQRVTQALVEATSTGIGLGNAIADAGQNFDKLDQQQLAGLQQALDSAKQKMLALADAAKAAEAASLDRLYQLQGDKAASENLRFEQEIADLRKKQAEAQKAGNQEAQAAYARTLENVRAVHDATMANIEKEQKAAKAQAAQPSSQAKSAPKAPASSAFQPSGESTSTARPVGPAGSGDVFTLHLALPGGKTVPATVPNRFENDLRELNRQRRAS